MKTIEKILGYPVIPEYNIELLRKAGFFNGTGTKEVNFDSLISNILSILTQARFFDPEKALKLKKDIEQLVIFHDVLTYFKGGFMLSNIKFSLGLFRLLYKFPLKYRVIVSVFVYRIVSSKVAKRNYKRFK